MINKSMTDKNVQTQKLQTQAKEMKQPSLNEQTGFFYSSSLKISDPKTGQVLVNMRCD